MGISNWISFLLGSGVLVAIVKYLLVKIENNSIQTESVKRGIQALLRDRLYQMYEHYSELGYAPIATKENFENMWNQYHNLGQNGVMDHIHEEFGKLPTKERD